MEGSGEERRGEREREEKKKVNGEGEGEGYAERRITPKSSNIRLKQSGTLYKTGNKQCHMHEYV